MNERWKEWLVIASGLAGTLMLLNAAVSGSWTPLLFTGFTILLVVLVVKANGPAYLAFGTLAPFGISLGIIQQVPALGLALMISVCGICLKTIIQGKSAPRLGRADWMIVLFYLYLLIRYCVDPVFPGKALGLSEDITGFRSWLDHLLSLIIYLFLGYCIATRADVLKLFRWLLVFAVIFAVIFLTIMFIPGMALSQFLANMGITPGEFDNGWRRFVFLPTMGLFMLMAYMLPTLFGTTPVQGRFLLVLGLIATIAGGNRGSTLALLVMMIVVWMLRKRRLAVAVLCACIAGLIMTVNMLHEQGWIRGGTPLDRVLSVFSPGISTEIGVMGTMEWRVMRWKRAMEDIKEHPWFGMGYGGLRGYFRLLSDVGNADAALEVERDVATGSTHNGYVSSARALGIPITLLFVVIMARRIMMHRRLAALHRLHDRELFEVHAFLCAYLIAMLCILMVGAEIRTPSVWLFIVLGLLVERLVPPLPEPQPG